MTLITDFQYFSPVILFSELSFFSDCILDQYDKYKKMTFRNRCTVSGPNGIIRLSIPLVGGRNQKRLMKEVRIENRETWQTRHWKTIEACYNKSPFLDHYRNELEGLYGKKFEFLIDWNLACLEWVCDKLSIATRLRLSDGPIAKEDATQFTDHRNKYLPSTINTLDPSPPRYAQVFEDRFGFIPNLSILDKLFCDGKR